MHRKVVASAAVIGVAGALIASASAASATPVHPRPLHRQNLVRALTAQAASRGYATDSRVSSGGITVSVPSSERVYNKGKVTIKPVVHRAGGVHKVLGATTVAAYEDGRKVGSGRSVHLPAGTYQLATTVGYRSYAFVTRHRTVTTRVWHRGGDPAGTRCVVSTIDDSGDAGDGSGVAGDGLGTATAATCTNQGYPSESRTIDVDQLMDDQFTDASGAPVADLSQSSVGEALYTDEIGFSGYYTTGHKQVPYTQKKWTGHHRLTTRKLRLVVRDAGYLKVFSGGEADDVQHSFTTTASSHWVYVLDCNDYGYFGVNWQTSSHYGDFGPEADAPYGESSDAYAVSWDGHVTLDVFAANCGWAIGIFSKQPVR